MAREPWDVCSPSPLATPPVWAKRRTPRACPSEAPAPRRAGRPRDGGRAGLPGGRIGSISLLAPLSSRLATSSSPSSFSAEGMEIRRMVSTSGGERLGGGSPALPKWAVNAGAQTEGHGGAVGERAMLGSGLWSRPSRTSSSVSRVWPATSLRRSPIGGPRSGATGAGGAASDCASRKARLGAGLPSPTRLSSHFSSRQILHQR